MSWSPQMDAHYMNTSYPYSTVGSFMDYFEGLAYEHVNFIFAATSHGQESPYASSMNTSLYKFGLSDTGSTSYYDYGQAYVVNDHVPGISEYRTQENSSANTAEQIPALNTHCEGNTDTTTTHGTPVECPRNHPNSQDYQVIWQDNIDPDNMTYEELLELGEAVGTQSRGLTQELISLLPISKYKCGFFTRKKSRCERCVICQMEYKRRDRLITLPCKHVYHAPCGSRWLTINKACPICYTEVFGEVPKN